MTAPTPCKWCGTIIRITDDDEIPAVEPDKDGSWDYGLIHGHDRCRDVIHAQLATASARERELRGILDPDHCHETLVHAAAFVVAQLLERTKSLNLAIDVIARTQEWCARHNHIIGLDSLATGLFAALEKLRGSHG